MRRQILLVAAAVTFSLSTASAGVLYTIDDNTNTLLRIDPATAAVTVVGPTGISAGDFGDLSYNPADGKLYWVAGRDNDNLYTIDPATGLATLVGFHGIDDLFALAWDTKNNVLYAEAADSVLYTLNPTTGAATVLGSNSGPYPGGLVYNPVSDILYVLEAGTDQMYTVDRATGATTLAFGGSFNVNDNGVAYDPNTNSYWVASWNSAFYHYDATFSSRTTYSYSSPLDGIAYAGASTATPEPGTLLLLGGGLVTVGLWRRRRPVSR